MKVYLVYTTFVQGHPLVMGVYSTIQLAQMQVDWIDKNIGCYPSEINEVTVDALGHVDFRRHCSELKVNP